MTRALHDYNIPSTEYEIHFAAQAGGFHPDMAGDLASIGFRDDGLVTQGIVYSPNDPNGHISCPLTGLHVTWDTFDRGAYLAHRNAFDQILGRYRDRCVGYAHAEIIQPSWDLPLNGDEFNNDLRFPVEPFLSQRNPQPKRWDIHLSADIPSLDPRLQQVLLDAQMYYIDLRKRSGLLKRVFTVQGTNSPRKGLQLFHELVSYFRRAGGMRGSIKFEQTCYWVTCGTPAIVPPVISNFSFCTASH